MLNQDHSSKMKVTRAGEIAYLDNNKQFHNLDGPAIEWKDGGYSYYIHGKNYPNKEVWSVAANKYKVRYNIDLLLNTKR